MVCPHRLNETWGESRAVVPWQDELALRMVVGGDLVAGGSLAKEIAHTVAFASEVSGSGESGDVRPIPTSKSFGPLSICGDTEFANRLAEWQHFYNRDGPLYSVGGRARIAPAPHGQRTPGPGLFGWVEFKRHLTFCSSNVSVEGAFSAGTPLPHGTASSHR